MSKSTIKDVASRAGVSKATVSAVINEKNTVRDSTRDRVLEAMKELNYRPSPSARRRFRRIKDKSLGLIIKEIDNPYYTEIIAGAKEHADEEGYTLLVATSEGSYDAEREIVDLLESKETDGLLLTPTLDGEADLSHLFELKRRNYPFVLLEEVRGLQASLVDVENVQASKKAVDHLIAQGHKRIVHFAGPEYSLHSEERIDGVRRAFSESRLAFGESTVVRAGAHVEDGYRTGLEYFKETAPEHPTAVTCYNDLVALGVHRALTELGLRVPDDVSLIGYDDMRFMDSLALPLATVRVPKREMGRIAAEILIRQIESNEVRAPEKVYLEAEFVPRQSTRPPADET